MVYIRPVYLADAEDQIEREVKPALLNFLALSARPVEGLPPEEESTAKGYDFYASGALASLRRLRHGDILSQEIAFVDTLARVAARIRRLRERAPVTELARVPNFGELEHWKVIETQELFARQTMPAFR